MSHMGLLKVPNKKNPTPPNGLHLFSPGSLLFVASFADRGSPVTRDPSDVKSQTFKASKAAANLGAKLFAIFSAWLIGHVFRVKRKKQQVLDFRNIPSGKKQWDPIFVHHEVLILRLVEEQLEYILLGIGSITISPEFPRLPHPTTPGILTRIPKCHDIGNLTLGQVCRLLSA